MLEHCREGGPICWFTFFVALRDGNKMPKLCLLAIYSYGILLPWGSDILLCLLLRFCSYLYEAQCWVITEWREEGSGRTLNEISYNSRNTQLLCRRFSTSKMSRCGDWSRVTDHSESCNAFNVKAKQSNGAVWLHYDPSQRGCLFTSQHGVTFCNIWVIINTVVCIGVLTYHLVFVTERSRVFTLRNRMFMLCVIYISD